MNKFMFIISIFCLANQFQIKASQNLGLDNQANGESKRTAELDETDENTILKRQESLFEILNYRYPKETKALLEVLQNRMPGLTTELDKLIIEYCQSPNYERHEIKTAHGGQYSFIKLKNGNIILSNSDVRDLQMCRENFDGSLEYLHTFKDNNCLSFITMKLGVDLIVELKNGNVLSCQNECSTIKIWNKDELDGSWEVIQELAGHKNAIKSIIELTDGKLVSCSNDHTIKIWQQDDNGQFKCVQTLQGHMLGVVSVAELKKGNLASCSQDGTIKIWKKYPTGFNCIQTLEGHIGIVTGIVELNNGCLVSSSSDNTLKIWKRNFQNLYIYIETLPAHTNHITSLIKLHNGDLATCSNDDSIKIWRENGKSLICLETLNIQKRRYWNQKLAKANDDLISYIHGSQTVEIFKKPFANLLQKES